MPTDLGWAVRSQIDAWMEELEVLRTDPRVRKFVELQEKIDEADALVVGANTRSPPSRSNPFDRYDAFEFARDLTGRDIPAAELTKLTSDRFPEISEKGRRLMIEYLIEHGAAGVVQIAPSGRPTWYRFGSPISRGAFAPRKRLGIPENELSAFKSDDLEDLAMPSLPPTVR
jgi:hypothetical protein